ncbi:chromosome partitioning protein [Streptomyces achromogenes]|uniref:Chromosome partitioning protein n=1 Tax=Streptomyces achromogenes TaxID=67255 RepID=A0ABU0QED9_STRAH|nr:ParA family protein [Streptomyces achromogenes]MDQ0689035.1 chromosome partitioning protein [Streptomyces achromogenes]
MAEDPDIVAEVSEKGGVGKTSLTAGLIAVAAEMGLRVGGVDLDPRSTLTDELGITDPELSVNDVYYVDPDEPPRDPAEIARKAFVRAGKDWPSNVWVLPCIRKFGNRETDQTTGMEFRLKRALWGLRDLVDVLFLDVPPRAGGKIVGSALIATKKVLIPATLTDDGHDGATEAMTSIKHYTTPGGLNEGLEVSGIVRSIVPREREYRQIHQDWSDRLVEDFGDLVLPTIVRNYAVREVCRTGSMPITAAPGREAKLLQAAYREVLFHTLPHLKEK